MKYTLSDLFDLQMGKTPSRSNPEYWSSNDNKWISIADLTKSGMYIKDTKEFISDKAVKESKIKTIPKNTVVMSFKLSIGKTAITTEPIYSNEAIMAFIDKGTIQIIPSYIYYLFSYMDWRGNSNKAVMGKTLNKATLSAITIDVPTADKQRAVTQVLDEVSKAIESKKQQLEQLDNLIKARFAEMFENDKYDTITIKEILADSFWLMPATPKFINNGIPYITSKNIKNRAISFDDVKYISQEDYLKISKNRPIKAGDIIVSMIGTLGQIAIIPKGIDFYGQNVYLLRLNDQIVNTLFFCEFFSSDKVQQCLSGKSNKSTQAYLKANHIEDLLIPLPPLSEQKLFADFVIQIDNVKTLVQKSLKKTQLLFDSLMQEYFG